MTTLIEVELKYRGELADRHFLDFYDAAEAQLGFQRSLALTVHLVLNGTIITQAPALKGANILIAPPDEGSWKVTAVVAASLAAGAYSIGTAPKDTPIGHLVSSAYDYVVSESLGFHVDYSKTLGQQYEELRSREIPKLTEDRFDSLIEKCESSIVDMHRPIAKSNTAEVASITSDFGRGRIPFSGTLDIDTYEYMRETFTSSKPEEMFGRISSFNMNTHKGRIYIESMSRTIPFELSESANSSRDMIKIIDNMRANVPSQRRSNGVEFAVSAYRKTSKNGRLKGLIVLHIGDRGLFD